MLTFSGIQLGKNVLRLSQAPTTKVTLLRKRLGAQGIIVVYDVTDKESLRAVDNWMADVEKFASESAIKILVGNKCDAEDKRKVSVQEGKDLAARYNISFMETSAKMSSNVNEAFQMLSKEIKAKVVPKPSKPGIRTGIIKIKKV